MINQDDNQRILITIDSSQQFITIYRQEKDSSSLFTQFNIQFRSNVEYIKLIQTTTIMDNDEKKKSYVLILLDDETIQLLDTNQISQASLQPEGLFTRIKSYNVKIFLSGAKRRLFFVCFRLARKVLLHVNMIRFVHW
jgi:hypothetical protein